MKIYYETKCLVDKSSIGKAKYWQGQILYDGNYYTRSKYWQTNIDGSTGIIQYSEPSMVLGKNIGRSNETTPRDQAVSNIESIYNKKIDKGYTLIGSINDKILLPMLAHKYEDRGKDLPEEFYIQPKLDGMRALYRNGEFISRQGKTIDPKIVSHLIVNISIILDGELMLPYPFSFQDTMKAIKKYSENTTKLKYYVYDVLDTNKTYLERLETLDDFFIKNNNENLIQVETKYIKHSDLIYSHQKFIMQGYEGTIIRDPNMLYTPGYRNKGLLKYKDFLDDEYTIIGGKEGSGKEVGCVTFRCKDNSTGVEFDCRPKGTDEERKKWFQELPELIGKQLTVRYQNLSDDGIPRFPVGWAIRQDN